MKTLTEAEFDEQFTMLNDHPLDSIQEIDRELGAQPADHIWTYIDGDEGGTYLIAGVHWVNAWGFAVTKEPHKFDIEVEIESSEDEEERMEEDRLTSSYDLRITGLDAIYETTSYIDAVIALMSDIEANNSGQIAQIQAKHPEFEVRIDLVPLPTPCGQSFMAGQMCVLPKGHEGGHR